MDEVESRDVNKVIKKLVLANWILGAACGAGGIGVWLLFGKQLPPQLPLFYSRPWGEEQLAAPIWMTLPLIMAIVGAIVSGLVVKMFKKERVLAALVLVALAIMQIILILGLLRIVMLVT